VDVAHTILLVLHAVAATVLTGAAVHNGQLAFRSRFLGERTRLRLRRVYPAVVAGAWVVTFALGLLLYPTWRIEVRGAWLEAAHPPLVAAFELKEHWLAAGLLLLGYLVPSSQRLRAAEPAEDARLIDDLSMVLAAVVVYAAVTGLTLTGVRPA
jgi:hypothetical protein